MWTESHQLARRRGSAVRPQPFAPAVDEPLWKSMISSKSFEKTAHQRVEIPVLLSQVFHLSNRVDNGRVVLPAEAPADFRQRRMRQRLAEVHRDLPRHRDRLRVVP